MKRKYQCSLTQFASHWENIVCIYFFKSIKNIDSVYAGEIECIYGLSIALKLDMHIES